MNFITVRLCHSLHSGRGVCGRHPRAHTPLGKHPLTSGQTPRADIPPGRHLTRADTPPSWPVHDGTQTPLQSACRGTHLPPSACRGTPPGGHCSGRCASYWNAFLLEIETKSLLSPHDFLWSLTSAFDDHQYHNLLKDQFYGK